LSDIAHGLATDRVRDFIVGAYVRGRSCVTAQDAEFEDSTAVFTKRRYRDKWNRTVVKRVGESHAHCIKIKARVRAKGQRGTGWYGEKRVQFLRAKCRTQMLWLLTLAGDWHDAFETEPRVHATPHMMRVMLSANLAVDQRFANGTQGRLMHWHPAAANDKRRALPSCHREISARFLKETAKGHRQLFPDIDHIDCAVRPETLRVRGEPVILQLPIVPSYALTIHKTQLGDPFSVPVCPSSIR